MNNEKINEMKSLDTYFPKGNKQRGKALVVCAEAFLLGRDAVFEEVKEILKKYEHLKFQPLVNELNEMVRLK